MTINRQELHQYLNKTLMSDQIKDYCPNGLQIEGKAEIKKIVTGVTASEALIDAAIEVNADAILVHHGYFWKGEAYPITGMKKNRIAKIIKNDINLFAYHLPIDVHPELGNNAQLAKILGIGNVRAVESFSPLGVVMQGELSQPTDMSDFGQLIQATLGRQPLISDVRKKPITKLAWCTGGGQSFIDEVAEIGVDAFLTGEASEKTIHSSRELNIDFISAGHHATERCGVEEVGKHLAEQFDIDVEFIDIHNPV